MKLRILAVALLAPFAGAAMAGTHDPVVNERQAIQHERIEQGIASGELTKKEAARLRTEQRAIRAEERAFKSDGNLTKNERKQLERDLNRSSRDIYNQKHDAQVR
ncbi:MAG TPA: hypothetical protein VFC24_04080 [Casimicrobiaceae bacterium]|nr:hypothetical protein [Casimicrobiaceae bacterium]